MVPTLTSHMLELLAPDYDASVWVEPRWRTFGYLETRDGRRRYWNGAALDLNTVGSAELSRDKAYTNLVLRSAGFKVPKGHAFGSASWCERIGSNEGLNSALLYAESLGYPVFVKPNSSQGGRMVYKAFVSDDVSASLRTIFENHNLAIVEEAIDGKDARVLVLDGEVVLAYERLPLSVLGDGKKTIRELMMERSSALTSEGRDVRILEEENRIQFTLRQCYGMSLADILPEGKRLALLPSANLATGGTTRNILTDLHESYKEMAINATKVMNLRFAGVDIVTNSNWSDDTKGNATILEVNGKQPAVTHFAQGHKAEAEQFYRKVIEALLK